MQLARYSDPAMEDARYQITILYQLAGVSWSAFPPAIFNFRRLLKKHELTAGFLGIR